MCQDLTSGCYVDTRTESTKKKKGPTQLVSHAVLEINAYIFVLEVNRALENTVFHDKNVMPIRLSAWTVFCDDAVYASETSCNGGIF